MTKTVETCCYDEPGYECHEPALENGFCYWHDATIVKNNPDDVSALEDFAKRGGLLRGISLKRAKLAGIDLVKHNSKDGYDLTHADLYRADLSFSHLFNTNFCNASLMKTNLKNANLHCANLRNCNLLGIRMQGARIENVIFGDKLIQEELAVAEQAKGNTAKSLDYFEQAEEIYRDLRKTAEREGVFTMSGEFIRKELTMRRYQCPLYSGRRLMSKITDIFCGYGELPGRVVGISILLIFICALIYFFTGINYDNTTMVYQANNTLGENIELYFTCLYYSVVTFTTLGYGDITPYGFSRAVAAFEAFTGSFTIALFVVVFVKKMTR